MKRSYALHLIANQLDFLAGTFEGVRTDHTKEELAKADVILTTLESAGMQAPNIYIEQVFPNSGLKTTEGYKRHFYALWESEGE